MYLLVLFIMTYTSSTLGESKYLRSMNITKDAWVTSLQSTRAKIAKSSLECGNLCLLYDVEKMCNAFNFEKEGYLCQLSHLSQLEDQQKGIENQVNYSSFASQSCFRLGARILSHALQ